MSAAPAVATDMLAVDDALSRLLALHPKRIDLSLDRLTRLLDRLDNPQHRLPPVLHVAGTNGKGSTVAMLAALAAAHGLTSHAYTSPHLVRFNERIALADPAKPHTLPQPIDDARLLPLIDRAEQANGGQPITFFEITTAIAFLAFSEQPADLVLLETGLGGRLDATNVIDQPVGTAITPIGMDHMAFLGPDLTAIAGEKAGIIKPGVPMVLAPQPPEADRVIRARAAVLGAPVLAPATIAADQPLALAGPHQRLNAGVALALFQCAMAARHQPLDPEQVQHGLASACWPARLQKLPTAQVNQRFGVDLSDQATIWLDGAHNPEGIRALATALDRLVPAGARLDLVIGVMANKDLDSMLPCLRGRFRHAVAVPVPGTDAGRPAAELANALAAHQLTEPDSHGAATIHQAADMAGALAWLAARDTGAASTDDKPHHVMIAGSLYLAGAVLSRLEDRPLGTRLIGV